MMLGQSARTSGYNLDPILSTLGISRSTWYYYQNRMISLEHRYSHLRPILDKIINLHPEYGHRRIKAELQRSHDLVVNHKVIFSKLFSTNS